MRSAKARGIRSATGMSRDIQEVLMGNDLKLGDGHENRLIAICLTVKVIRALSGYRGGGRRG